MIIVSIVGARPQFIKALTVSRALKAYDNILEVLVHTGQHYDFNLSDVFFDELDVRQPDHNLEVGSGTHGYQTGRMLQNIENLLLKYKPNWVLVFGDTNSTLAGALAAAKLHIPLAHIEAGLRSFNRKMPEEINRVLTDHCSDLLFAPTIIAVNNLKKEGIAEDKIDLVGDVMLDAAIFYAQKAEGISNILKKYNLIPNGYILATLHRAENTDVHKRLKAIMKGLSLAAKHLPVVFPVHPRTELKLNSFNITPESKQSFQLIKPLGYLDMIMLEKNAALIATDSGGVQKEAFFYKVPCITLREETEWVELVDSGWNHICPPLSSDLIYEAIKSKLGSKGIHISLYGDGKAANKIAKKINKISSSL